MKKLLFLLLMLSAFGLSSQVIKNVDAETFKTYLKADTSAVIDLRTDEEITTKGKIAGSRQIDYFSKDAEKQIGALDKSKTYLIYCAGGGRSSECADLMNKLGFRYVVNLQKGYDDWKRKGFEVEVKQK